VLAPLRERIEYDIAENDETERGHVLRRTAPAEKNARTRWAFMFSFLLVDDGYIQALLIPAELPDFDIKRIKWTICSNVYCFIALSGKKQKVKK